MPNDERYEVNDPNKERALKTIAALVDEHVPEGMGFCVLLFDFGEGGSMFYMSNARREDVHKMMREFIAKGKG